MGVQFDVVFKKAVRNGLERLVKTLDHFCSEFRFQFDVVFKKAVRNGRERIIKALGHFCSEFRFPIRHSFQKSRQKWTRTLI